MISPEKNLPGGERQERETKVRTALDRLINIIFAGVDREELKLPDRQQRYLGGLSLPKKAEILYRDLTACARDLRKEPQEDQTDQRDQRGINENTLSRINFLLQDPEVRAYLFDHYSRARASLEEVRRSEPYRHLEQLFRERAELQSKLEEIERQLNIGGNLSDSDKADLQTGKEEIRDEIEKIGQELQKLLEPTLLYPENTNLIALRQYFQLREYRRQLEENGFVWLPSRFSLLQKILNTIQTSGKAPFLIGPPGTGKTTLLHAVSHQLTGKDPEHISCTSTLSDEGLLYKREIDERGTFYNFKGTIGSAMTGYENSRQERPTYSHGRPAVLDELIQLNLDRALAIIKEARTKKPGYEITLGDKGYKVLPGFALTATSNTPIDDERVDREFYRIPVNYFEMTKNNPELFEFILCMLIDPKGGKLPPIPKELISPYYEFIKDEKELEDGSIKKGEYKLIENPTDKRHGFLYRLAWFIRVVQDCYIHGSKFNEKGVAQSGIYYSLDDKGNIKITGLVPEGVHDESKEKPAGERLVLSHGASTLTPFDIQKWVEGYLESGEDLVSYFKKKIKDHLEGTDPEDGKKIKAIADYFYLFDEDQIFNSEIGKFVKELPSDKITPLTPLDIGYLTLRTPRPWELERKTIEEIRKVVESPPKPPEEFNYVEVALSDGERVRVRIEDYTITSGEFSLTLVPGRKIIYEGGIYIFVGVDEKGRPVFKDKKNPFYKALDEVESTTGLVKFEIDEIQTHSDLQRMIKEFNALVCGEET